MKLLLQRISDNGNSTIGLIHIITGAAPLFMCFTIEDEFRAVKLKGQTRIKAGTYPIRLRKELTPLTKKYQAKYPWFKYHLEICNVPEFVGVYIHIGNDEDDTDGCVLVGDGVVNNRVQPGQITQSTNAFQRLYTELFNYLESGKPVSITIKDEAALCSQQ